MRIFCLNGYKIKQYYYFMKIWFFKYLTVLLKFDIIMKYVLASMTLLCNARNPPSNPLQKR
jgi:hypothetical protein